MYLFKPQYSKLLTALVCALAVQTAQADELDLTELSLEQLLEVKVTSASKYEQRASEAPSAVQVISREEIERHGWRTLSDALVTLPGLYISNDRAYDYLGARGFLIPGDYNTRFLLLVDGQRNNDNIYQQALMGTDGWLDMSVIERIEYIPGPGSAIYGSNAMFGVINVITRSAGKTPQRLVSTHVSQDGYAGVNMLASQAIGSSENDKGTGLLMQYSNEYKAGRDRSYTDPLGNLFRSDGSAATDGVAHDLDQGRNQRLFLRVDRGEWSIRLLNHERITIPSSALYLTVFDDPALKITDAGSQVSVSVQHELSSDSSVYARLGYADWSYLATYGFLDPGIGYYKNYDDTHGQILDGELRYQAQIGAHHLLTGLEFAHDLLSRQQNFYSVDPALLATSNVDINTPSQRYGVFVQDEFRISDSWLLSLGLRQDTSSNSEASQSPRLGLIWHVNEAWTAKFLSGRAFRSPNSYEAEYSNGIYYLSNPALKAETVQTTEGVIEWRSNSETRWQLSLYQNRLNNLIQQVDTGSGLQYQNGAWAQVQGLELGVEKNTSDNLKMRASIAASHVENASAAPQDNSPEWISKASMSMPVFGNRVYLAAEIQLIGARSYIWNNTPYSVPNEALANATATFPDVLTKGLQAQLRISNLFNSDIQHPAANEMPTPVIPQNGRTLMASLSYAF
jgi:outer membrane receptor for ferrienterochelin and colicin